jgi:hypothetical protein
MYVNKLCRQMLSLGYRTKFCVMECNLFTWKPDILMLIIRIHYHSKLSQEIFGRKTNACNRYMYARTEEKPCESDYCGLYNVLVFSIIKSGGNRRSPVFYWQDACWHSHNIIRRLSRFVWPGEQRLWRLLHACYHIYHPDLSDAYYFRKHDCRKKAIIAICARVYFFNITPNWVS